jgi:hypothetical protein
VWSFGLQDEHVVLARLIDDKVYYADSYNVLKRFSLAAATNGVAKANAVNDIEG